MPRRHSGNAHDSGKGFRILDGSHADDIVIHFIITIIIICYFEKKYHKNKRSEYINIDVYIEPYASSTLKIGNLE